MITRPYSQFSARTAFTGALSVGSSNVNGESYGLDAHARAASSRAKTS